MNYYDAFPPRLECESDPDGEILEMLTATNNRLAAATRGHREDCDCGLCRNKDRVSKQLDEETRRQVERRTTNAGQGGGA